MDELERRLRAALRREADAVEPGPHGLTRIRAGIERRTGRAWWLPGLPVLAAAATVAAVVLGVSLYVGNRPDGDGRGGPTFAGSPTTGGQASAAETPSPPPSATPDGGAGTGTGTSTPPAEKLPNLLTSWPHADRDTAREQADADLAGPHPYLRDPRQTAVAFVRAVTGTDVSLSAGATRGFGAGIEVDVTKKAGESGRDVPVTSVYLVRVEVGGNAPYAVVSAGSELLSVTSPGAGESVAAGPTSVRGRITGVDESIAVRLFRLSGSSSDPVYVPGGGMDSPWRAEIAARGAGHAVVLATTSDAFDGSLLRLAAVPVRVS